MNRWTYEIIEGYEQMFTPQFVQEWQQLALTGACAHVFFTPALVKAWLDTYMPLRKLSPFVVVAKSEDNMAILPLTVWQKNWKNAFLKTLIPIGYSDFDYHNPLFKYAANADSLAEYWGG